MNTLDFTSTPVIGPLMQATGITDGWIIISVALAILFLIFLIAWICSVRKSRTRLKQIAHMEEEMLGLQAINNLPPLHSSAFGNPGDSIVFASSRELKKRRDAIANTAAPENTTAASSQQPTAEFAVPVVPLMNAEESAPLDPFAPRTGEADKASESVTAQVHEAIFASVSSMHKDIKGKRSEEDNQTSEEKGTRALKSSDIPSITKPVEEHKADNADALARLEAKLKKHNESKKKASSDNSKGLSSRIPKL